MNAGGTLTGTPTPSTSPADYPAPDDDAHTFTVAVTDTAGKTSGTERSDNHP